MTRLDEKIKEILVSLEDLNEIVPKTLEEYISNKEKKAACERYIEKIIGGIIDLAFMTIKLKKLELPQDENDAFDILLKNKIISEKLAERLKAAKGMRNIIAHEYGKVDDEIVFESLTEELRKDTRALIQEIKKVIK